MPNAMDSSPIAWELEPMAMASSPVAPSLFRPMPFCVLFTEKYSTVPRRPLPWLFSAVCHVHRVRICRPCGKPIELTGNDRAVSISSAADGDRVPR